MTIRDAVEADIDQITAIYNEVLTNSTAIYSETPTTPAERLAWFNSRREQGYPVLVLADGQKVTGFASYGDFRPWPGYRFTVEGTIHLHPASRGAGLGSKLLQTLVDHARTSGKHIMIAGVDSSNTASLRFLEKFGFEPAGCLREVGFKFGRFLDLVLLRYRLAAGPDTGHPPPPSSTLP